MDTIRQEIAREIRRLVGEWLERGDISRIRDIGDGLCEDFAQEVLDRLHARLPETRDSVRPAFTDDWWVRELDGDGNDMGSAISFEADIPRLRAEGAPLPDDVPDDGLKDLIGSATHMWIVHDGLSFDATAPDGASHFLLMPFFADQIAGYRAEHSRSIS